MVRPTKFEITQNASDSRLTLAIAGELDISTVPTLTRHLDERFESNGAALTLDLRELTFMDSSGLRLLIALNDRSQREPWELRLIAPTSEAALMVLRVTGAYTALPFDGDDQR